MWYPLPLRFSIRPRVSSGHGSENNLKPLSNLCQALRAYYLVFIIVLVECRINNNIKMKHIKYVLLVQNIIFCQFEIWPWVLFYGPWAAMVTKFVQITWYDDYNSAWLYIHTIKSIYWNNTSEIRRWGDPHPLPNEFMYIYYPST